MNSRNKGKRGELEWARVLSEMGFPATRGQQHSGGVDSPDVKGGIPGTHAEVKRVERLDLAGAMAQAIHDAGDAIPYVAHRRNNHPWLVTVRAVDFLKLCEAVHGIRTPVEGQNA